MKKFIFSILDGKRVVPIIKVAASFTLVRLILFCLVFPLAKWLRFLKMLQFCRATC